MAKKIKSESRLSSVPASFAESCPKFQSATPSHWNLWHAVCLSTWAFPWKLSETVQLELAKAININLLTLETLQFTCAGRWLLRQPVTCIKMGKKHDTPGTTFLVVPAILYGFQVVVAHLQKINSTRVLLHHLYCHVSESSSLGPKFAWEIVSDSGQTLCASTRIYSAGKAENCCSLWWLSQRLILGCRNRTFWFQ